MFFRVATVFFAVCGFFFKKVDLAYLYYVQIEMWTLCSSAGAIAFALSIITSVLMLIGFTDSLCSHSDENSR